MKKITYLILVVLGIGFIASCEKDFDNPVLNVDNTKAPVLNLGFTEMVLDTSMAADTITFNWDAVEYDLENIAEPTYRLQMKHTDSTDLIELTTTVNTSYETTVKSLNNLLLKEGFPVNEALNFDLQVEAFITTDAPSTRIYSDNSTVAFTAYEVVSEEVKTIYILGNGTEAGWDNEAAIAMTPKEDGVFIDTVYLDPGAGEFMKFISVLGEWAPQWGTDDTGTPDGGPLVYRPTEDVADPVAIPIPDVAGDYIVEADTVGLTYTIAPASKTLSLLSANGQTVEMEKMGNAKFTTTSYLTDGAISFVEEGGTNSTWKISPEAKGFEGELSVVVDKDKVYNFDESRKYNVTIDLGSRSFSIIPN